MVFFVPGLTLCNVCGREQITSCITYWLLEQESCSNLKKRTANHLKILDFEQYTVTGYVSGTFLRGVSMEGRRKRIFGEYNYGLWHDWPNADQYLCFLFA